MATDFFDSVRNEEDFGEQAPTITLSTVIVKNAEERNQLATKNAEIAGLLATVQSQNILLEQKTIELAEQRGEIERQAEELEQHKVQLLARSCRLEGQRLQEQTAIIDQMVERDSRVRMVMRLGVAVLIIGLLVVWPTQAQPGRWLIGLSTLVFAVTLGTQYEWPALAIWWRKRQED